MAGPITTVIPKIALAMGRSSRSKDSTRMAWAVVMMPPPAMPWRKRNTTSSHTLVEIPHRKDAAVNMTMDARK